MFLSVFDIFKIGVGPSSSHTMGPMLAAARFLDALRNGADRVPGSGPAARIEATLHGSLAFTGKGHATDRAVVLGLLGFRPETLDADDAGRRLAELKVSGHIDLPGIGPLAFDPEKGVLFDYGPPLPGHANGLVLRAFDLSLNRPVAIKVLAPQLASSGPARQRFLREARAAAASPRADCMPIRRIVLRSSGASRSSRSWSENPGINSITR